MVVTNPFADVINCSQHPAAFSQLKGNSGLLFTENKFGLTDLTAQVAVVAIHLPRSGMGILYNSLGYSDFRESRFSVAYARNLDKLAIGIQFNYSTVKATGYPYSAVLSAGASFCWWVSEKLVLGVRIMDPGGPRFSKSGERLAWTYKTGMGYEVSDKVLLSAAISKVQEQKVSLEAGIIYHWQQHFYFRAGFSTGIVSSYLCTGWRWKWLRIEASSRFHQYLGFSPGFLFLFSLEKQKV